MTVAEARSVHSCPCCDCSPKELGKKENLYNGKFTPKENRLIYGLSDLHLWIRCFEGLLNIAYKKITKNPRSGNFKEVLDRDSRIPGNWKISRLETRPKKVETSREVSKKINTKIHSLKPIKNKDYMLYSKFNVL